MEKELKKEQEKIGKLLIGILLASLLLLMGGCTPDPLTTTLTKTTTAPAQTIISTVKTTLTAQAETVTSTKTVTSTLISTVSKLLTQSTEESTETVSSSSSEIKIASNTISSFLNLMNLSAEKNTDKVIATGKLQYNFIFPGRGSIYAEFYNSNDEILFTSSPQSWYLEMEQIVDFNIIFETERPNEVVKIIVIAE